MTNRMTRRSWLKWAAIGAASASTLIQTVWAQAKQLIDMSGTKRKDPANQAAVNIAKGLNYVDNGKAAEASGKIKRVEKAGVAGKLQVCGTCQFNKTIEEGKTGECQLIAGVLIHEAGWCNSWIKNAQLKNEDLPKIVEKIEGSSKPAGKKGGKAS